MYISIQKMFKNPWFYIDIFKLIIDNKDSENEVSVKKGECDEQENFNCWWWKGNCRYFKS